MKPILIYGSGGFGREVEVLIRQINDVRPTWDIKGYIDDDAKMKGEKCGGSCVLGGVDIINGYKEKIAVAIAIGNTVVKEKAYSKIHNGNVYFPELIHPEVSLSHYQRISIGQGCIICEQSVLTTDIVLADFVTINLSCTIGHDAVIGNYCSFMPDVNISGNVIIDEMVFIGTNASVINNIHIGANTTIGAGAAVVSDIPAHATAVGVPAKVIKQA